MSSGPGAVSIAVDRVHWGKRTFVIHGKYIEADLTGNWTPHSPGRDQAKVVVAYATCVALATEHDIYTARDDVVVSLPHHTLWLKTADAALVEQMATNIARGMEGSLNE